MRNLLTTTLAIATALIAGCATLDGGSTAGAVIIGDGDSRVALIFSDRDRDLIHRYYRRQLPPGLAKRRVLPPGLAKRRVLPPGLNGRALPHELERQLSPLHRDYLRLRIDQGVVLMNRRSRIVFDIIQDLD